MRGNRIHPSARRRIREYTGELSDRFDHRLLQDGIHDDVLEDDQLAQLADAVATLQDARDERDEALVDTVPGHELEDVIQSVRGPIEDRLDELCAERCRAVLVDGDTWVANGWEEREEVDAARDEALAWLHEHDAVARRLWGADDDLVQTEGLA